MLFEEVARVLKMEDDVEGPCLLIIVMMSFQHLKTMLDGDVYCVLDTGSTL